MGLSWSDLRACNGSQREGFEELCSQLARLKTPDGAEFIRTGNPDSGVECFCRLEDGQEWGWQAKFFRDSLRPSQWNQTDRSVKVALEAHPNLVRYFVCVPRNRSDGRRPGITTELQRWKDRVAKWEGWAHDLGMTVEFVWWGSSELLSRLSRDSQAGRCRFWIGAVGKFGPAWFDRQLERAVEAAGPRYTPEIHVDLPLSKQFELLGRLEPAVAEVRWLARNIQKQPTYMLRRLTADEVSDVIPELRGVEERVDEVVGALSDMPCRPDQEWPLADVMSRVDLALRCLDVCEAPIEAAAETYREANKVEDTAGRHRPNPYSEAAYQVRALQSALWGASETLSRLDRVVNSDLMLVTGDAGSGKTHLLCDLTRARLAEQYPTVLLMGQQFTTRELPWIQARAQLDLGDLSAAEFVGALEAAAQAANSRALFMIDAINEGEGYEIWPQHLAGFLSDLSASPWIAVVLSIRSPYVDHIVPEGVRDSAYELTHRGFAYDTYAAVERFCEYYGLDFPATPLLRPEFDNPLFLKTLCAGLAHGQSRRIPVGSEGISTVFGRYLNAIDAVLAKSLDYDPHGNVVARALGAVASELAETGTRWLPRQRAQELVNRFAPSSEYSRSLYRALVDNGLLMESPGSPRGDERIVHFGYDWFADHLIATHLIDRCGDAESLASSLAGDDSDGAAADWHPRNAPLEALSVLLPERLNIELPEVLAGPDVEPVIRRAFLKGLPWRDTTTIGAGCRELIEDLLIAAQGSGTVDVFDALVTCATVPAHPLGAALLDEHLRHLNMPDRDAAWSRYLYLAYGERGPVDRLLDWAEKHSRSTASPDRETTAACATVLAWFLTSSHRFVRDRATKGLVALLTDDAGLTCELVERFNDVDDPYVRERVMATAYGVAMRNTDLQALAPLADLVYQLIFADGEPPPHILLRDYASGIIERALHLGAELNFDLRLVAPPYGSVWPDIPQISELEKLDLLSRDDRMELSDAERAQARIWSSVMTWDFARYVIGTNVRAESRHWLSVRNADSLCKSADELAESFKSSLAPDLQRAFNELWNCTRPVQRDIPFANTGVDLEVHETDRPSIPFTVQKPYLDPLLEEPFVGGLSKRQRTRYEEIKTARGAREPRLALEVIQRFVLWRVFDLGWTIERFGNLDRHIYGSFGVARHSTDTRKPERIGKKYQWIAYHEILAYISDHYQYRAPYEDVRPKNTYRGAWQLSVRDIDPFSVFTGAIPDRGRTEHSVNRWRHETAIASVDELSHERWLEQESDIPDREQQLRFVDPESGGTWVKLQGSAEWQLPTESRYERYEVDQREIWLNAYGYFIEATAVDQFISWSKAVDFWNRWMPEPPGAYPLFFGELGWSFAFEALLGDSLESQIAEPPQGERCPVPLQSAAFEFVAEAGGYDCSVVEGHRFYRPNSRLVEAMTLRWTGHGADFVNEERTLVAFDPSAHRIDSSALLVREESLASFLHETGSALVWAIVGEKCAFVPGDLSESWAGFLRMTGASVYGPERLTGDLTAYLEIPTPGR